MITATRKPLSIVPSAHGLRSSIERCKLTQTEDQILSSSLRCDGVGCQTQCRVIWEGLEGLSKSEWPGDKSREDFLTMFTESEIFPLVRLIARLPKLLKKNS